MKAKSGLISLNITKIYRMESYMVFMVK